MKYTHIRRKEGLLSSITSKSGQKRMKVFINLGKENTLRAPLWVFVQWGPRRDHPSEQNKPLFRQVPFELTCPQWLTSCWHPFEFHSLSPRGEEWHGAWGVISCAACVSFFPLSWLFSLGTTVLGCLTSRYQSQRLLKPLRVAAVWLCHKQNTCLCWCSPAPSRFVTLILTADFSSL